ncbi:MAG TPA: hypothetical protein DCL52_07220 [Flavobacteriaceae bacterium]|nr:hypothetical protein [Flavobacteriaceae bacterium]|tara:strand:+ start:2322 stop:2708 length:387 start_codon:yes stop_codon:yes gene_type:complete
MKKYRTIFLSVMFFLSATFCSFSQNNFKDDNPVLVQQTSIEIASTITNKDTLSASSNDANMSVATTPLKSGSSSSSSSLDFPENVTDANLGAIVNDDITSNSDSIGFLINVIAALFFLFLLFRLFKNK